MDAGGLDRREIDKVDVGHDDRTTLKSGLHLYLCNLSLLQTSLIAYCLQYIYEYMFQVKHLRVRVLSYKRPYETYVFIHCTNSPPLLVRS